MSEQAPRNTAAEQAVLGALMLSPEAPDTVAALHVHDFTQPTHQLIFETIESLANDGQPFDAIAVAAKLAEHNRTEEAGGRLYLKTLLEAAPLPNELRVRDLRALVDLTCQREPGRPITDLMSDALDKIEAASSEPEAAGVPTGFTDLDALLGGLRPGLLHVLTGTAGIGTSTLATNMAHRAAVNHGFATLIFSGESPRNEVINRMLAREGRVPLHSLRTGRMQDEEWTRVARVMSKVGRAPLHIDDYMGTTAEQVRTKSKRFADAHDLRLIVIDGANLYARPTAPESLWAAQARLSADLKRLAVELRVPIVVTTPVNRGPDNRVDRRPTLRDIASSSAYGADADVVIGVHREDAYDRESPRWGEADLLVLKNRYGPTATVVLAWQGKYARFFDMPVDLPKDTEVGAK